MSQNWGSQSIRGLELGVNGEKTVRQGSRPNLDKIVKLAELIFRPTAHSPFSPDHHPPSFQCPHTLPACSGPHSQACPNCTASKILGLIFYAYAYSNLHLISSQSIIKEQKNWNRYFTKEDTGMTSTWKDDKHH